MEGSLKINEEIKENNTKIKKNKKLKNFEIVKILNEKKKTLKEKKETELVRELEEISRKISCKNFEIILDKKEIPLQKPIYIVPNKPEYYFAIKQIQYNIFRLFNVKQSSRNNIVKQVIGLLEDKFPKYIIRTDITDFFESINHDPLKQKIIKNNLLTPLSRKILLGILESYKSKSNSKKGIPRGIGVSAYLAEMYMRDIDKEIMNIRGVTYYGRYVDDIIIIFSPAPTDTNRKYLAEVKNIVEKKHKIKLNPNKTEEFDLVKSRSINSLIYLGYEIEFGTGKVVVTFPQKKIDKYRSKIRLAFDHYVNYSKVDERNARRILVKRIRFLTGNTRLANNKKNILIGVYYSNSILSNYNQLMGVDSFLNWQINHRINSRSLKKRLNKYSFTNGFKSKHFSPFNTKELSEIMKIWK